MRTLQLGEATIDLDTGRFEQSGSSGSLTKREIALLAYLADRPEQVVSHDTLLQQVWGYRPGTKTFTVYSTIRRVRQKLERDAKKPEWLCSESGGYVLRAPAAAASPFIGRDHALAWLRSREGRWSTLTGAPGVGTSRTAREFCTELGGQWVEAEALAPDKVASLVRDSTGLLVLDGLAPFDWSGVPSGWVVATSRAPLGVAGEEAHRLGLLSVDDSVSLIRALRPEAAAEGLVELVSGVDRLPHVLCLLSAWMEVLSVDDLVAATRRPDHLLKTRGEFEGLDTVFSAALDRTDPSDRELIERLAVFEGSFTVSSASQVVSEGAWLGESLARLHAHGWLERTEDGRFELLRTTRAACDPAARVDLRPKHLDHFSNVAREIPLDEEALADCQAALVLAFHQGQPGDSATLLLAIASLAPRTSGLVEELEGWLERWPDRAEAWTIREALGVQCRRTGQYRRGIAWLEGEQAPASAQICLGTLLIREGELDEAEQLLTGGLEKAQAFRDLGSQGSAWMGLGVLAVERSNNEGAERCFREAIDFYRADEAVVQERLALNNLGHMLRRQGDMVHAEASYRRGLELCGTEPSRDRALLMSSLGIVALCLGRASEALPLFMEVEVMHRGNQNKLWEAQTALNLGLCHMHLEDYVAADVAMERSRRLALRLGDTGLQVMAQAALAEQRQATGDLRDATHRFEGALALAEAEGRRDLAVTVQAALAVCDQEAGRPPRFAAETLALDLGPPVDVIDAAAGWLRLGLLAPKEAKTYLAKADDLMARGGIEKNVGLARLRRRLTKSGGV